MALPIVYRGTDRTINFTLKNGSGTAINITSLAGIVIWLYEKKSRKLIAKYSKNVLAGHNPITTVTAASGIISIQLTEAQTLNLPEDEVWAAIKTKATDADWADNDIKSAQHLGVCCIEDSLVKSVSTL